MAAKPVKPRKEKIPVIVAFLILVAMFGVAYCINVVSVLVLYGNRLDGDLGYVSVKEVYPTDAEAIKVVFINRKIIGTCEGYPYTVQKREGEVWVDLPSQTYNWPQKYNRPRGPATLYMAKREMLYIAHFGPFVPGEYRLVMPVYAPWKISKFNKSKDVNDVFTTTYIYFSME